MSCTNVKPVHELEDDEVDHYVEASYIQFLKWSHTPNLPGLPSALQAQINLLNTLKVFWPGKANRIDRLTNAMSSFKAVIEGLISP